MEMKGNEEVIIQDETQPISNAPGIQPYPQAEQIPKNDEETRVTTQNSSRTKTTYPCRYCEKSFSTWMALGGHQNAHKGLRDSAKRQAESPLANYQPYPTNYTSYPKMHISYLSQFMKSSSSSSASSSDSWSKLEEYYAKSIKRRDKSLLSTTSAPPPGNFVPREATNTKFFGVQDFFGPSSAPKATPSNGASGSGSGNVINLEDDEKEKDTPGLDLDLKL